MAWIKNMFSTPFSDLWLPTILIGLVLILLLALHWFWLQWRASSLEAHAHAAVLNAAAQADASNHAFVQPASAVSTAQLGATEAGGISGVNRLNGLSDIHALTAPKQPIWIEDLVVETEGNFPTAATTTFATRIDPSFELVLNTQHSVNKPNTASIVRERESAPDLNNHPSDEDSIFFNPHASLIDLKAHSQAPFTPHPQFHYQARFTWGDATGKQVLNEVLPVHPWAHDWAQQLPVEWANDAQDPCSAIAAWQTVHRRGFANPDQANDFKQWCDTIANLSGAKVAFLATTPWEAFLDEAHSLLIGLDSVIMLKVSVPLVQLDLFAQSLLAARFTQSQEHWVYQDSPNSASVCLERLWQQSGQNNQQHAALQNAEHTTQHEQASEALHNNAVFQLIIDIPHLDSLDARKVYMRLRAVARASAAILQSAQGAHLSEGMLDRYSRELLLKQEALTKADVIPGSMLAKQVFKPHLRVSQDLVV